MTRRKTNKEFKKEVFDLVGDEYTFLDNYTKNSVKIRVKHNKCGNTYEVKPSNFLSGKRCPYCSGCMKKTNTQFKQEVFDLVGNEYTFLDTYTNNRTKLRVKHTTCGTIYKVTPTDFLQGKRCPYCAINTGKTDAQFKREVFDLVGNEYTFLDNYQGALTNIRVKHNKCGNIYKVQPSSFLRGHRCPYCNGGVKRTNEQFKEEVFDLVGDEYTFLDAYTNNYTKIKVKHNKCDNIYKVQPSSFLRGQRCPYCFRESKKKTDAQFKQEVHDLVGNEYVFLEPYTNAHTKIRVKHSKCGTIYEVAPTEFFSHNTRCPYCNSPKGELYITKILKFLNIEYECQKTFDDLRDNHLLSYDFFIPGQSILIEYQGIQHYESVNIFGGDTTFKVQQKHDKMKADYAKSHHYNLIAVPYTEDTFSKIKKYLLQHGLTK